MVLLLLFRLNVEGRGVILGKSGLCPKISILVRLSLGLGTGLILSPSSQIRGANLPDMEEMEDTTIFSLSLKDTELLVFMAVMERDLIT